MKRFIALLMCLAMLVLTLASCGDETVSKPEAERPNLTLRMAIVVDDKTTAEGVEAMQKVFNEKCEVSLNTRIDFEFFKASEYKEKMTALMEEVEHAKLNGDTALEDAKAEAGAGGTVVEDDEYKYPAPTKGQFDILLIADAEMYEQFIEEGWIVPLNTHFKENFKPLNTKIHVTAKQASAYDGNYYGVPANTAYGSYTYLMVNKEAADLCSVDPTTIHSFSDAYALLSQMQIAQGEYNLNAWAAKYGDDFAVIRNTAETFINPNVKYLSQDFTSVSLIGSAYGYNATVAGLGQAKNLLRTEDYTRYLEMRFVAEKNNYYGNGNESNFLFSLVEGDYGMRNSDADYYFCPITLPVLAKDDIFGGMLAVSTYSVDEKRSLEIVQEFMTNATRNDLLNIVLYGDPQTNYGLEDGCVNFRNMSNYGIHQDYLFGNLREYALPCADFGQNASFYEDAWLQIREMDVRTPLFDETFADYFSYTKLNDEGEEVVVNRVDAEKWAYVDALSQEKYEALMASADLETFRNNVTLFSDELMADPTFYELLDPSVRNDTMTKGTLGAAFFYYTYNRSNNMTLMK